MKAYFNIPMMHPRLKTWQANIVIPVGDYFLSYTGDDGNTSKQGSYSRRHYLMIWHKDNEQIDLTESFKFPSEGDIDILKVIKKLKKATKYNRNNYPSEDSYVG